MKWLQLLMIPKMMTMMMPIVKMLKVVEIGTSETLAMLDRLVNLQYRSKEERSFRIAMKDNLDKIRVLNK